MSDVDVRATRPLLAAARSDLGRVRGNNEDLPVLDAERGVFGVIDGVGGQAAGELAASIARDVILQRLARPLGTPAERVREAIAIANNEIFRRACTAPELAGMTCVVTLAVVNDGCLTVGHVGDTRLYKIRPDGLRKLTHDHSPVGEREDAHEIDELEAMRHPRRHEVFRDVGSALRDKDEDEYVEVHEDTLEDDAAILVCSDGLTDMIPSSAIHRIVREQAGDPQAVVDALVAAANEAGGRDNVTAVYAEGLGFAAAMRGVLAEGASPASSARRAVRATVQSRVTWFTLGVALGALSVLGLVWRAFEAPAVGGRTIAAASTASETVGTLASAIADARAGDVIRLEPGTYPERVVLPPGVSLAARVPGTAIFVRPGGDVAEGGSESRPGAGDEWVAITATGDIGGAVAGIRIASTPESPVHVGVRVLGGGRSLELLEIEGPVRAGVEVGPVSSATLRGSRLSVGGLAVGLAAGARLEGVGNLFVRHADAGDSPAIAQVAGAELLLRQNVFAGFGPEPVAGLTSADREHLRAANVVVSAGASTLR